MRKPQSLMSDGEGKGVPSILSWNLRLWTAREKAKRDRALAAQSRRFHERMNGTPFPAPSILKLWGFRMARTNVRLELTETDCDYGYYMDKGWFQSDYYYPVRLNPLMKAAGRFFDAAQARKTRRRKIGAGPAVGAPPL